MSAAIPSKVDVIIIGTGLTNSILAAACSRIGRTVLHLDENHYYGKDWASFTFQQLIDWIRTNHPQDKCLDNIPEELVNKARLFCIDLAPRFLYSNGDMVDLLVKSNVARYHEFKNNIRILCSINDDLHVMPCRRNEVFTSVSLKNLVDKRRLTKFIELCREFDPDSMTMDELESYNIPIKTYLEERGLNATLQEYIINSIAMVKPFDTTSDACSKIKKFLIATERHGRSPFLFPLYGCGEFPQSFCRLSAVFGGLYCLNTRVKDVKILEETADEAQPGSETGKFSVKFSDEDHTVTSDMLLIEQADAIDLKLVDSSEIEHEYLSRAILFTKSSIVPTTDSNNQDMVSFLRIPPEMYIVYLWTRSSSESPEDDLVPTVDRLFKAKMDSIVWKYYYRQSIRPGPGLDNFDEDMQNPRSGLFVTSPICDDIDYSNNIREAETLFGHMCPGQEFLPRAPDPDEIISS